jgi:polysaccharide export outer membrane protein
MMSRACVTACLAAIAASALTISPPAFAQTIAGEVTNYTVGAQDVLTITVFDAPEASGKFTVEADGTFTFPLIGRMKAGGQTLRAVEEDLRNRLADGFFRNPQISVAVEQYRSQRIFVLGEVRQPGTYPLTGEMTLIEAFARAGSATGEAAGHAVIVRASVAAASSTPPDVDAISEVLHLDLTALETGRLSNNVALRDGDTIFVPRAGSIYVFGQVRSPGSYSIQKDTTVLQALSLAGGVGDRGSTSRIRIVRLVNGAKTEISVGLDDPVQTGDTIMVRERFF